MCSVQQQRLACRIAAACSAPPRAAASGSKGKRSLACAMALGRNDTEVITK